MHLGNGILFNTNPRFVVSNSSLKITSQLAEIRHGHRVVLELGNLDSRRDWGFAGDYVRGMLAMVQHPTPKNYVLATGRTVTVRDFVAWAAEAAGMPLEWFGTSEHETGIDKRSGKVIVKVSESSFRPAHAVLLIGSAEMARRVLGWEPEVSVQALVQIMIEEDTRRAGQGPILH